jgi:hypothetical protein
MWVVHMPSLHEVTWMTYIILFYYLKNDEDYEVHYNMYLYGL